MWKKKQKRKIVGCLKLDIKDTSRRLTSFSNVVYSSQKMSFDYFLQISQLRLFIQGILQGYYTRYTSRIEYRLILSEITAVAGENAHNISHCGCHNADAPRTNQSRGVQLVEVITSKISSSRCIDRPRVLSVFHSSDRWSVWSVPTSRSRPFKAGLFPTYMIYIHVAG